ncbi:MAG: LLM class flavin-dependent oxidoreductase, partial [Acidimicrobiales bacterium]|nr:LLM class flavin-dependent oxidoreductase [Acidimicrobiales bacterium]
EDGVNHHGRWFHLDGVTIEPKPLQRPIDVWLGGLAPSELRRVGRLGDGWLPSFCTPHDVARGWARITDEAGAHGRSLDPEHLGALIAYRHGDLAEPYRSFVAARRPDVAPEGLIPAVHELPAAIEAFTSVGASKFVLLPLGTPDGDPAGGAGSWSAELERLAADVLPLQT